MPRRSAISALGLALLLACNPKAPTKQGREAAGEAVAEDMTPCEHDYDCVLSCIEPDDCCPAVSPCTRVRHRADHEAILAARSACTTDSGTAGCSKSRKRREDERAAVPVCEDNRCTARLVDPEPPEPLDLSDYERGCASDEDCMLVDPQPCAKCGCASAPIAASEEARFRSAMSAIRCPRFDPWPNVDCGACSQTTAWCDAGECKGR